MADQAPKFKIVDNTAIIETYANKLIAASFDGGAVVLTLGSTRFVPESGAETPKEGVMPPVYVTQRLALSPGGAMEVANALNNMLKTMGEMQQQQQQKAAGKNLS
ncbi:MAG TPA: hypothetical protein VIG26_06825 [Methyloceanibacter sp.]|jgi:hypothetical protein